MAEEFYNHIEIYSKIYCGTTDEAIKDFQIKSATLIQASPNVKKNYLTSLNHGIYNYILLQENVSLHDCCKMNDLAIQALTTDTFLAVGEEILRSYAFCSDYLIEKYQNHNIKRTLTYIHEHLSEPLSLEEVAKVIGMNKCYLCDLFHKEVHTSFSQYVIHQRIRLATRLLKSTQLSIEEIALKCGYQTSAYFSKSFKKTTGFTPSAIRKKGNYHSYEF